MPERRRGGVGDVPERGVEALVELAAIVAAWARGRTTEARVRDGLRTARTVAGGTALEESILQSYLFLGYPAALNTFRVLRSLEDEEGPPGDGERGRRVGHGTEGGDRRSEDDGTGSRFPDEGDADGWARRGAEVCETVYGGAYDRLRANVRRLHPAMERWMVTEGYGKVLGRSGLPLGTRELCVVATLAVSDWPVQLHSHLRGAVHAGVPAETVGRMLERALAVGRPTREEAHEARRTWARVVDRLDSRKG